jgi:hypothetical protein
MENLQCTEPTSNEPVNTKCNKGISLYDEWWDAYATYIISQPKDLHLWISQKDILIIAGNTAH